MDDSSEAMMSIQADVQGGDALVGLFHAYALARRAYPRRRGVFLARHGGHLARCGIRPAPQGIHPAARKSALAPRGIHAPTATVGMPASIHLQKAVVPG